MPLNENLITDLFQGAIEGSFLWHLTRGNTLVQSVTYWLSTPTSSLAVQQASVTSVCFCLERQAAGYGPAAAAGEQCFFLVARCCRFDCVVQNASVLQPARVPRNWDWKPFASEHQKRVQHSFGDKLWQSDVKWVLFSSKRHANLSLLSKHFSFFYTTMLEKAGGRGISMKRYI